MTASIFHDEPELVTLAVTLTCGCSFHLYGPESQLRASHAVGYWYSCQIHSDPVRFDPEMGEPTKYDRNQQAVTIEVVQ